jgi:ubiquinone/menaquinone biosynthesis C-methylase UbiE
MSQAYNEMSYVEVAARYNDINHIPPAASDDLGKATAELVGENATILDLGAGAGRISVPIAKYSNMIAVDIEHHMQLARSMYSFSGTIKLQKLKSIGARS